MGKPTKGKIISQKAFNKIVEDQNKKFKADEKQMELLDQFGEKYGIIFQIRDDIFDFISTSSKIGKPVGNDIREGKFTLPLIYAYNQANETEQKEIKDIYYRRI